MQTPKCYHMAEAKEMLLTNSVILLFLFYLYECLVVEEEVVVWGLISACVLCSLLFSVVTLLDC